MLKLSSFLALFLALSTPAPAQSTFTLDTTQQATQDFVEANLLSIFYHELGHALIDILQLPVFGQEEDAADVASVLMLHNFYEEEAAQSLVYDTAFGFLGEAAQVDEPAWWDTHGPDLQRYYNLVCLFYGANPDERDHLAVDLDLPEERAETCEEEYELAADSWEPIFDQLAQNAPGNTILDATVSGDSDATIFTENVIQIEIDALNQDFAFPSPLKITIEPCDEANAFYDLSTQEIIMCTELADHLITLAPTN